MLVEIPLNIECKKKKYEKIKVNNYYSWTVLNVVCFSFIFVIILLCISLLGAFCDLNKYINYSFVIYNKKSVSNLLLD